MKRFTGIFTPIVTPFTSDDSLDEHALRSNVAHWMTTPLTGLVVLGSNGEAPQLDDAEADRVVRIVRDAMPTNRPMIVGTGRESTKATIEASRRAAAAGADAVLVRTPSFFKAMMTADVFVDHYTRVADESPVPVLLYNVAMFTGLNIQPEAVERLGRHPNIVGMKDSGGDMGLIFEFVSRTPDDFTVLAGSATTLVHALSAGCDGAILALAALLPDACVEMLALVRNRKLEDAHALQRRIMPLARSIGGSYGVSGLKAAYDLIGLRGGYPRPPLMPAPHHVVELIRGHLADPGMLAGARV